MSAELDYSLLAPEFDHDQMRLYLEMQLGLNDGQRVVSISATNLEHFNSEHRRTKTGVRLSGVIMGIEVENNEQFVDLFPDDDPYHDAAHAFAKELAGATYTQREVTWVGSVGFERYVEKPKPAIQIIDTTPIPRRKGW